MGRLTFFFEKTILLYFFTTTYSVVTGDSFFFFFSCNLSNVCYDSVGNVERMDQGQTLTPEGKTSQR